LFNGISKAYKLAQLGREFRRLNSARSGDRAHNDRLLLGPGPSNLYPEAMEELVRPVLIHLDPDYLALMADISAQPRAVFGTTNELTLPVSGIGSAGMQA
jgi:alanine-glyoxylate transaminase/serine-glyoxylate transaminase/serine-pyruvate transaminase